MHSTQQLYNGKRADGACVSIRVQDDRIAEITSIPEDSGLPELLPVLVDIQHNGALGVEFSRLGDFSPDGLRNIATFLRRHGVGRCLPTLITYPEETLNKSVASLNQWLMADADLSLIFRGLLHEGVFISPEDGWRGVHDLNAVCAPDWDRLSRLDEKSGGRIRIVNVAPETPGALDFIRKAVAAGKHVALGHCGPDASTVHAAADAGATLVTHFGNGAAALLPRFENPFWAMLNEPRLRFSLIGDGFHLPPDLVGTVMRSKGMDGFYMVSDAAHISGCPPGRYDDAYAMPCEVEPDGHLHVADSGMLAGAWFQLDRSVEWLMTSQGLSLREAWRQCSEVPARILGEQLPAIEVGEEASFVLARWNQGLVIEQSVHAGVPFLSAPIRPTDCHVQH